MVGFITVLLLNFENVHVLFVQFGLGFLQNGFIDIGILISRIKCRIHVLQGLIIQVLQFAYLFCNRSICDMVARRSGNGRRIIRYQLVNFLCKLVIEFLCTNFYGITCIISIQCCFEKCVDFALNGIVGLGGYRPCIFSGIFICNVLNSRLGIVKCRLSCITYFFRNIIGSCISDIFVHFLIQS